MKTSNFGFLFASAALAQVTLPATTIPPACISIVEEQAKNLESSCGVSSDSVATGVSQPSQLLDTLTQSLDKLCSTGCESAITKTLEAISAQAECANIGLGGVTLSGDVFRAVKNAACVKTQSGGFCLASQAEQLKPALEAANSTGAATLITGLISNKDFICTDCVVKELEAIKNIPGLPAEITTAIADPAKLLEPTCQGKYATLGENGSNGGLASKLSFPAMILGLIAYLA